VAEATAFAGPRALLPVGTHYCPGCSHGLIHRLIAELLDELGLARRTVGIAPVGCAVLAYDYFATDFQEAAHGRAPAVATGVKRAHPELFVLAYQGDGDLASIGAAEILHCANRGEKVTVVFVNNATYGMTGGQMAPTSLPEQETATSPGGRDAGETGYPIRVAELLTSLKTPAFIARGAVHTVRHIIQAKGLLRQAFRCQTEGRCFSLVELLAICPTNWGLSPDEASRWLERRMLPYYPLGVFKTPDAPDRAPLPLVAAPGTRGEAER
jgi:2-oxoglutarate ferredoxin oxidoreductase subunit beta